MRDPVMPDSSRWFSSIRPPYGPEDNTMLHALEALFDSTGARVGRDGSQLLDGLFEIAHHDEPLADIAVDLAGDTIRVEGLGTVQNFSTRSDPNEDERVSDVVAAVISLMVGTWTIETISLRDQLLSRTYTRGSERHRTAYSVLGCVRWPARWTRRAVVTAQWT